jgi:hypothetical protein
MPLEYYAGIGFNNSRLNVVPRMSNVDAAYDHQEEMIGEVG